MSEAGKTKLLSVEIVRSKPAGGTMGIIARARVLSAGGVTQSIHSRGQWGVAENATADALADIEAQELAGLRAELQSLGVPAITPRMIDYEFKRVKHAGGAA